MGDYHYLPADLRAAADKVPDGEIRVFDVDDREGIARHIEQTHSTYGTHVMALSAADIDALLAGKCIVWGQGEYATIILPPEGQ